MAPTVFGDPDEPTSSPSPTGGPPGNPDRGGDDERGRSGDRGHAGDDDGEEDEPPEATDGADRRPGHFVVANTDFDGRYVDFVFDHGACRISDYRVYGVALFESIQLPGRCGDVSRSESDHVAQIEIESQSAELRVHDAPNGLLRFDVDDESALVLRLASGVAANASDQGLSLSAGNLTARLFLTESKGGLTANGTSVHVTDAKGTFLVHPASGTTTERRAVFDAIRERKVGGQIDVLTDNGTVVNETLAFDDVMIKVSRKNDSAFRFVVDADLTEGRSFVVNFAPGLFRAGQVGVRFFDVDDAGLAEEVSIVEASSLADVLDVEAGEPPEFWITHDAQGTHVVVAVPKFSVHVFEVLGVPPQVIPVVIYGIVFGVLFVAVAGVGMVLQRRSKR